jgi:HSP20 family protein
MAHNNNQTQAIERSSANQLQVQTPQSAPAMQGQTVTFAPGVNICDLGNEWVLVADIPGADPQNINITCEDRLLTLHAPVPQRWPEGAAVRRAEYNIGDYHRTFRLGEDIDMEKVQAEYQHGVLTLHLPKAPHAQPRKIPIKTT